MSLSEEEKRKFYPEMENYKVYKRKRKETTGGLFMEAYYDIMTMYYFIRGFLFGWLNWKQEIGFNSAALMQKLQVIQLRLLRVPWFDVGKENKIWLNTLSSKLFYELQSRARFVTVKAPNMASRGYLKLSDLLNQSKIQVRGKVLDLCAGRGGWDQKICEMPQVEKVTSITLGSGPGREGHEDYTAIQYKGRDKVIQIYDDIANAQLGDYDLILFDGGESDPDYDKESSRFFKLLSHALPHINEKTNFILKILTPFHKPTVTALQNIQQIYGKGAYYRCSLSKPTSSELYFISTRPHHLPTAAKQLLMEIYETATLDCEPKVITQEIDFHREEVDLPEPLDLTIPISNLGPTVADPVSRFRHWESLGVFPTGVEGSAGQSMVNIPMSIMGKIRDEIPDYHKYKLTDTTPPSFRRVFSKKIDSSPKENHKYNDLVTEVMTLLGEKFDEAGYDYRIIDGIELIQNLNKQGAPGPTDEGYQNIGEFLEIDNWQQIVKSREDMLIQGTPIGGVWKTMGKREKKKMEHKITGSRMVAYMDIPERIIEQKYCGSILDMTKPRINPCGVGGLGLHDLGNRLEEIWKGYGVNDDVSGFDTKVSATDLVREMDFITTRIERSSLSREEKNRAIMIVRRLYQIYIHPVILIPLPHPVHVRSELVLGRGQRMSGAGVTYSMNTITQTSYLIAKICVALEITPREAIERIWEGKIGMLVSGDDSVVSMSRKDMKLFSQAFKFDNETGKIRKNISINTPSPIRHALREVEFCSHYYERISFYDSWTGRKVYRMMPTRSYGEILAKASIWLGATKEEIDAVAWSRAMGYNLLVNYPHMRLCRKVGAALLSVTPENIMLSDEGAHFKRRPWMRPGEILEVLNTVLFGESTAYWERYIGFEVREFRHVGYTLKSAEKDYGYCMNNKNIILWGTKLKIVVTKMAIEYGGNPEALEIIGRYGVGFV